MVATSTTDPYTILGVDRSAGDDVIAAAHKRLARTYHPDVAGDGATLHMMRINAAFDRIRDRRRRAAYAVQEAEERADRASGRHSSNGHGANGHGANGHGANGHGPNGHGANGHGPNGHGHASHATTHGAGQDARQRAQDPGIAWAPARDGTGGAGRPPGRPFGSVLPFGRHIGWSIGEIARVDPGYLVWLEDRSDGRPYLGEIDRTLRQVGYRKAEDPGPVKRSRFGR